MTLIDEVKARHRKYSFFVVLASSLVVSLTLIFLSDLIGVLGAIIISVILALVISLTVSSLIVKKISKPLHVIAQAIAHVGPNADQVPAPTLEELKEAGELASSIVNKIYSIISPTHPSDGQQTDANLPSPFSIAEAMPLPIIVLDKNQLVRYANKNASDYLKIPTNELVGSNFRDKIILTFSSQDTLDTWSQTVSQNSVTATNSWDRVRFTGIDQVTKQFDMAAHYSKDNPAGFETTIAIFDHTDKYSTEDNSTSYVALAVHELRTPLTMLRGYIEVFEDELSPTLTPELQGFMTKMNAAAQTLTAFVSNILNVARVDENAMTLSLQEANWNDLLANICKDLELRVKVRGKTLQLNIQPGLPTVGVDKISIYEVLSNLIDNAVKYSGDSNRIVVHARLAQDGSVETIVQDFGIGIPSSIINHLFTKFYRSHRSKGAVSGSGLGLYLVKAIVSAHGGNVWVQSKEGEGSSFGFTLKPFANISTEAGNTGAIEREAHGWIKNHSMYRR